MRSSPSSLSLPKSLEKSDPKKREELRTETFGNEYKSDFDYSKFFNWLENLFEETGYRLNSREEHGKEKLIEILNLVKNNNYKLSIRFLESLNNEQKYYLASIFIEMIERRRLSYKFKMGKSLLIWMIYWYKYKYKNQVLDLYFLNIDEEIKRIGENFEGFNSLYFMQAIGILRRHYIDLGKKEITEEFLFDAINEYNAIKNLDEDIDELNKKTLNLGKDFSIGTLHTNNRIGTGFDKKYRSYHLDKNGERTKIASQGDYIIEEENLNTFKLGLDRNHESMYETDENGDLKLIDASGIMYDIYLDSPSGIALFYKEKPVAVIAFFIRNGNEIFINQMQKIVHFEYDNYGRLIGRHYSKEIENVEWQDMLYKIIKILAKKYNIPNIVIQGGENNKRINEYYEDYETPYFLNNKPYDIDKYLPKNKGRVHLSIETAKKVYDNFALGKGFNYDRDGNLSKDLFSCLAEEPEELRA